MSEPRPQGIPASIPAGVRVHAVVPAAGRGERFGGEVPKQFLEVGDRPLVVWTVERLLAAGCSSVTVAVPEAELARTAGWIGEGERIRWVVGGETRQASVVAALKASPAAAHDLVAVHDGARAALDAGDFVATVAAAGGGGAVLGRQASDTMKEVVAGRIVRTVERKQLFHAETPQVFRREVLERALDSADREDFVGTDEASLVERLGGVEIRLVEARRPNPKVTFAEDFPRLAGLLLAAQSQ